MIAPNQIDESERFSATAVALLQKYINQLYSVRKEAQETREKLGSGKHINDEPVLIAAYQGLQSWFNQIQSNLFQLAGRISARLEHTEIDDSRRMELEVLLADFQANIVRTQQFLSLASPKR